MNQLGSRMQVRRTLTVHQRYQLMLLTRLNQPLHQRILKIHPTNANASDGFLICDFPEDVYEASEKMGGKRLSVMSSYADPLGYYNKVGEIKGKLLADSKHTGESSNRPRKQDAGEKNSDGPPEIPADASKKAQSAIASTNSEKPSNKHKRQ